MATREQTYYNMKRLHRVFAVSSVVLLAATIALLLDDHAEPWKGHQRRAAEVEMQTRRWLQTAAAPAEPSAAEAGRPRSDAAAAEEIRRLRSTYWTWDYGFPLPGKRWLELPILEAFNSPRKIETIWSEDLTQAFPFGEVPRHDRCTTCHQGIDRSWPQQPQRPLYPPSRILSLQLLSPRPVEAAAGADPEVPAADADPDRPVGFDEFDEPEVVAQVEQIYGLRLAASTVTGSAGVTVSAVRPGSPAAKAELVRDADPPRSGEQILAGLLAVDSHLPAADQPPGLWMGDVILQIDGQPADDRRQVAERLLNSMRAGPEGPRGEDASPAASGDAQDADDGSGDAEPAVAACRLTIRRGLQHPLAAHPRLDLFVGESSPHPMQTFGCSICHGGQGSATAFEWASHTPDSLRQRADWRREHEWFENEDWPEPMYAGRFLESSCTKCHHRVTDLEPSERFARPPAAKLLRGYQLVLDYGCYGCHEINGYSGSARQGPDLRLSARPAAEGEPPGTLRKPGPSLQHVASRRDADYLSSWLRDPQRWLPETRMPRFFGLWSHLSGGHRDDAAGREAAEIESIAAYLTSCSLEYEPVAPPSDINDSQPSQSAERGRELFQTQGCLVCHKHRDFSDADAYREQQAAIAGPDLSDLAARLRVPGADRWLYSWIKQPGLYDPRSVMPAINQDRTEIRDSDGTLVATYDPVEDLVSYLLQDCPASASDSPATSEVAVSDALDELVQEHLQRSFSVPQAAEYARRGIPQRLRASLKPEEIELLVADRDHDRPGFRLDRPRKLMYLGRKSIARYGCSGCHDIPGFEVPVPIGVPLSDWGRKQPSMLLFDHVAEYAGKRLHAGKTPVQSSRSQPSGAESELRLDSQADSEAGVAIAFGAGGAAADEAAYFLHHLGAGRRIGFLHQKLAEPRSYDYRMEDSRAWIDRQRMPQFRFSADEREAVMTFVLGLVAQPPRPRYVYQPGERRLAEIQGRELLDEYRCRGCHALRAQRWEIAFPPGTFPVPPSQPSFPLTEHRFTAEELAASQQTDRRGLLQASLIGQPLIGQDGRPLVFDDWGDELFPEEQYEDAVLEYMFQLWQPVALEGHGRHVGEAPLNIPAGLIALRSPSDGGFLTNYLLPHVVERQRQTNPQASGSQAWGWLPPPLHGQGARVQKPWLREYLLDPYPIRPAGLMRMPRYRLSRDEAETLANYFSAVAGLDAADDVGQRRNTVYLEEAEQQYRQRVDQLAIENGGARPDSRLDHALRIVADKNYCVTCHIVGDYDPQTGDLARAPDLSAVHHRLRADWLRKWIANPVSILPYTPMPVNIPYAPGEPHAGGIDQSLYPGTSVEQLDALVDLLMNFDVYAGRRAGMRTEVQAAAKGYDEARP